MSSFILSVVVLMAAPAVLVVLGPNSADAESSVNCWVCTTDRDPGCGDDKWTGTPSANIQKLTCTSNPQLQQVGNAFSTLSGGGTLSTAPVKSCVKQVKRSGDGKVLSTTRQCGIQGVSGNECRKEDKIGQSFDSCICTGDYCNASAHLEVFGKMLGGTLLAGFVNKFAIFGR